VLVAQGPPITKAQGDVTADPLKRLRMNGRLCRDFDWGHGGARARREDSARVRGGGGGGAVGGGGAQNDVQTWHAGDDTINSAIHGAEAMVTRPGSAGPP